jgi:dTDP-4-amino-4,6-dideoxygalactose transaminase
MGEGKMINKPKPWERRDYREVRTGTFRATDAMRDLIYEVLESGRISYGPKSQAFERQFAEMHDCRYAVLSNSGTSSLHVALQALKELHGWNDGDYVYVPASTFVATINVVIHNNLTPVFVDIEPLTYGMDPVDLEEILAAADGPGEPRAIIPVHLYGQPCRMTEILEIAMKYDLAVLEDSCEAMGVRHAGAMVGSMGQIGCFSTYNAHLITTGVGGIATTNDAGYAAKMRSLVNHGLDLEELNTDENFSPRFYLGRSFRFTHCGHSYRITELEAALGLAQLETFGDMLKIRRRNARHYRAGLNKINEIWNAELFVPDTAVDNEHAWMMFPIVVSPSRSPKSDLVGFLNDRGIETRDMMPVVTQPIYVDLVDPVDFPTSYWTAKNGFYIGCHQDLSIDDVEYVLEAFRRYFANAPD